MVKVVPTQEELNYLKNRFENYFKKQFIRTVVGSMIMKSDRTMETRKTEANIYFKHVLESFEKNDSSESMALVEKDFTNHMNFKLQIARRKTSR